MWYQEAAFTKSKNKALDLSLKGCFTFANEEHISVESVCDD